MEKVIENFIEEMDELIEESLTDEFADHGDLMVLLEGMISAFDTFKDKVKASF